MDKWVKRTPGTSSANKRTNTDEESQNTELNARSKKIRKYNEEFIKYGFTFCVVDDEERPMCVICNEKLANESMKPAKLNRHLKTKHKELQNKHADFFQRRAENLKIQSAHLKKFATIPQKALRASLEVSYLIGKTMKPHTIGESLILPAATKMTSIMHGDKYGNELKTIPLSRDTVSRRISEMSRNIESEVIKRIQNSSVFALQLDETTDITKMSQLIIYVRFIFNEDITETFLCCKSLEGKTTGEKIFEVINEYFETKSLTWANCVAVCTDGAAALTGSNKGLRGLIQKVAPHMVFNHCMIHRQALVAKDMDEELHNVLQDAVSSINYIKCNSHNSRLFSILCNEMGSTYERLLLHTEVRWLSRGKILRRIFDLRNEVYMFLIEKKHRLASYYINEVWLGKLSYLVDIFEKLNDLNLSLQGENSTIITAASKIQAFKNKLSLWQTELNKNNLDMFPCFNDFINENNIDIYTFKNIISNHIEKLKKNFSRRFEDFPENYLGWIRDPFSFDICSSTLQISEKEQLIELISDYTLRNQFKTQPCQKFWLSVEKQYPVLCKNAIRVLIQFASTYLCETGFSKLVSIKTKYRSRLNPEDDMRIAISNIHPNIDEIIRNLQPHTSH